MQNGIPNKKTGYKGGGPRFGIEKPAIPGPGRPRMSDADRNERDILKQGAKVAAQRLVQATGSDNEKNAIRASEIILSHVVPKLEEVTTINEHPLPEFTDEQLDRKLADIRSGRNGHNSREGVAV